MNDKEPSNIAVPKRAHAAKRSRRLVPSTSRRIVALLHAPTVFSLWRMQAYCRRKTVRNAIRYIHVQRFALDRFLNHRV